MKMNGQEMTGGELLAAPPVNNALTAPG